MGFLQYDDEAQICRIKLNILSIMKATWMHLFDKSNFDELSSKIYESNYDLTLWGAMSNF